MDLRKEGIGMRDFPGENEKRQRAEEHMLAIFLEHARSFVLARTVIAALEVDLFPTLQEAPAGRRELAGQLGLAESAIAESFFDVLVAFGFLQEENDLLRLTPLAASVLAAYESVKSWGHEMKLLYGAMTELEELLRSGRYQDSALSRYWVYKARDDRKSLPEEAVRDYSSIMDASQGDLAKAIVRAFDFSTCRHVIDFGGGYGRLAMALAQAVPGLQVTVADLPAVCEGARRRIAAAGLAERVQCLPVDFHADELPTGLADAILFVRVLHDWNDGEVASLLRRARACLRPPGAVVVVEPMWDARGAKDPGAVLSAMMLALLGGIRRSVTDYLQLLRDAGFREVGWRDCGLSHYRMALGTL